MLYEEIADAGTTTPAALRRRYERALADVVDAVGVDSAAAESGVEAERLRALLEGEAPTLTVEQASELFALSEEWPDAETIRLEIRDNLMLQMSSAVVDVDAIESGIDARLDAREIQQKVEGRQPMTLAEYALVYHYVASENPY